MAGPGNPWIKSVKSESDYSSSASVSTVCVDQWLPAHLSIQEEATFVTNWIKDRPEGLKLQNLVLATMTGQVLSSLPRNLTADVQYAIDKCESLGPG